MSYKFKEFELSDNFRKDDVENIMKLIKNSTSFTVLGLPGMGISTFLKFLISKKIAYFIHVDLYELPEITKLAFYKLIAKELQLKQLSNDTSQLLDLMKERLSELSRQYNRVVVVFNRFDQIKELFDTSLFLNLRSLTEADKEKIIFIFSSNKPLYEWSPKAFERGNLDLYANNYFLAPYTSVELMKIRKLYSPDSKTPKNLIKLSGGHFQLLQLLIKSERKNRFLLDTFVRLQVRRIYEEILNFKQRQQIKKIISGKIEKNIDNYLLKIGLVVKNNNTYSFFTPLLSEYIREVTNSSTTKLETKLIRLLEKHQGQVVSKGDIFETLWHGDPDRQSDWALNALIYRLRKNQVMKENNYIIISHKRQGYSLQKV